MQKDAYQTILLSLILFSCITLLTMQYDNSIGGQNEYGFPFCFYSTDDAGLVIKFNTLFLLFDLILLAGISILLIRAKNRFLNTD